MSIATLICLVVAISDGDTLTARCGAPGAYHQVKVRIAAIDAPDTVKSSKMDTAPTPVALGIEMQ